MFQCTSSNDNDSIKTFKNLIMLPDPKCKFFLLFKQVVQNTSTQLVSQNGCHHAKDEKSIDLTTAIDDQKKTKQIEEQGCLVEFTLAPVMVRTEKTWTMRMETKCQSGESSVIGK